MNNEIELHLPLDIPVSTAPRSSHASVPRTGPHALLARAQTRLVVLSAGFCGLFLLVALRLVDATLLQSGQEVNALGPNPNAAAPVLRADITDRNGEMLATSLPTKSLYADPKRIIDPVEAAKALAGALPDLSYEEILDKLTSTRRFVWLKRNLSPDEIYSVNALGQPGLEFQDENVRIYPAGSSVVHVTGVTDVDGHGLGGIERGLDTRLGTGGSAVALSLDLRLQHLMERELSAIKSFSAVGGTGMIMDIRSGELLAAVSLPDYAPGGLSTAGEEARFNRFSLGTYELGSVMKIVNTAAALESGRITLDSFFNAGEPIRYGRFTINDYHPVHRPLSVAEIFIYSSNICSARMALEFGPAFQHDFICRVGLCETIKTELPELGAPQIPSDWKEINAMTIAFGHGISITPLHLVRAAATTLNGGYLVTPTFLRHEAVTAPLGPSVLSARTSGLMRRIMRANVTHEDGSGHSAEVPGYFVGGKTGTAEKTQGRRYSQNARISSFLGAFPMDNPHYIVFAMVDEPKPNAQSYGFATGGWVAAPVVGKVIAQMAPLLGMAPRPVDDPAAREALSLDIRSRREQVASY